MNQPLTADVPAASTERVTDLVQKLVAAATAEVEAAAQRTRAQAQIEITQLHRTIDLLRAELQAERDKAAAAVAELAGVRASTSKLHEELDLERAEKARFAATLETVRLLVSTTDPDHGPDHTPLPPRDLAEAHDELTDDGGRQGAATAGVESGDLQAPAELRTFEQDATGHLVQLIAQIEEIYRSDLDASQDTSEIVRRLAANLAYARDAFARRLESTDGGNASMFDRYLSRLLESRSGTPFGRHLAMALRFAPSDFDTVTELQKEAS